jgi:phosphatidylinositol-3-phosphatase
LVAVGSIGWRRGFGICLALLVAGPAAAASLAGSAGAGVSPRPTAPEATGAHPCGTRPASTKPYKHIVVIMDENLSVPQWEATPDAPYTHRLAEECRRLTGAAGETHPSFPNYMAVVSGTFPKPACLHCPSDANNVFHQMNQAGLSWRDYNEAMPQNCVPTPGSAPQYRDNHNPAFWFTDLGPVSKGGDGSCAKFDVPLAPFFRAVKNGNLPAFSWIAPSECHNMHWRSPICEQTVGGTKADRIRFGDDFVKRVISALATRPSYQKGKTLVIVTWDEANEGSVQSQGNWGIDCSDNAVFVNNTTTCRVVTILVSARLRGGSFPGFFSHYSLTRAIERTFGLPLLGGANRVKRAPIY